MQLTGITRTLRESHVYRDVITELHKKNPVSLNVIRSARPLVIGAMMQDWNGPVIVLTAQIKRAYNISEQLPVWITPDDRMSIYGYAEPTSQFYERVPWVESTLRSRMETLAALMDDAKDKKKPIVVSSARALMQRTIPVNQFRRTLMKLNVGQRWSLEKLLAQWLAMGYEASPIVIEPGMFSRRGGVVDIFPVAMDMPLRIDFFDDEIDTLRLFDPNTQRSETQLQQATITPVREALPEFGVQVGRHLTEWFKTLPPAKDDQTTPAGDLDALLSGTTFPYLEHYLPYMYAHPISLLNYAPDDALIVIEDRELFNDRIEDIAEQATKIRDERIEAGVLPPDYPQPYLDWQMIEQALQGRTILDLSNVPDTENQQTTPTIASFGKLFTPGGRFGGQLRPVLADMRQKQNDGGRVIVVTEQAARLKELWQEQDTRRFVPIMNDLPTPPASGSLAFVNGTLQEGWTLQLPEQGQSIQMHLFTDAEIFGWSRPEPRRRKSGKRTKSPEANYADWREGDHVVHVDYGIGKFAGMRHRTIDGNDREYLVVAYSGTDMLYVPIHQADRLTKYIGADGSAPRLHSLSKQTEWNRVKSRAKKAVEEEAKELLALYAKRANASGFTFSPDTPWQHELEASFPYVETEDQLRSMREVKADMQAGHPMDRLICGDVGYGKTEVALRAAFKAVMDGKQVAVLVPTTVLAQQHFDTFNNRLAPFPVQVAMMSRFRTKGEQNRLLPRLASGEVDIVIGTHRILSQDITLKNLGLVIIDEEQRFGVKHKEHFKQLRTQVDVLTLTATPIPRTLYMSLTGVRDISMIQTPPEERLPVITHVGHYDEKLVRQAILREIERGGQVFFVHNRVRTIDGIQDRLEQLVPEARIITGHGQMPERELEKVMSTFARGQHDVLLSTAIIESGIDIPNANTLIVDRADWFGMAQLYQLRGRVGRSAQQAFAYLFHPRRQTDEGRERLETLAEHTNLGAGLQIAMRDLEIRGAGDILSTRQTGQVAAVGLRLYTQLMKQAIRELKGAESSEDAPAAATTSVVIDLPIPAYIPDSWLPEIALRLQIYRRIAGLHTRKTVIEMREELQDRFGKLPDAVEGLLYQIEVKLLAQRANATHIVVHKKQVQIKLLYLGQINREALAHKLGDDVEVSRTMVMCPYEKGHALWRERLLVLLDALATGIQAISHPPAN